MTSHPPLAALGLAALLLGTAWPAFAGEGHDHGDAAPAVGGSAQPRFAATSETFELVGVLDGRQVTLYLDRFADNAPVQGARIELEIAGARLNAQARGDDAYEVLLTQAPQPGLLPITATVTAGAHVDLLAGELDLHGARHAEQTVPALAWQAYAGWAAAALAALGVLVLGVRRLRSARPGRAGGAA